jgi:hypothetical protein
MLWHAVSAATSGCNRNLSLLHRLEKGTRPDLELGITAISNAVLDWVSFLCSPRSSDMGAGVDDGVGDAIGLEFPHRMPLMRRCFLSLSAQPCKCEC